MLRSRARFLSRRGNDVCLGIRHYDAARVIHGRVRLAASVVPVDGTLGTAAARDRYRLACWRWKCTRRTAGGSRRCLQTHASPPGRQLVVRVRVWHHSIGGCGAPAHSQLPAAVTARDRRRRAAGCRGGDACHIAIANAHRGAASRGLATHGVYAASCDCGCVTCGAPTLSHECAATCYLRRCTSRSSSARSSCDHSDRTAYYCRSATCCGRQCSWRATRGCWCRGGTRPRLHASQVRTVCGAARSCAPRSRTTASSTSTRISSSLAPRH